MACPKIVPQKTFNYDIPQSKYEHVPKLPLRAIILGSSGSGKGILLQNMILDIYEKNFLQNTYLVSVNTY